MTTGASGLRLGPYELIDRIGAAGMGEVWKATDTRLARNVAVQICHVQFAERFEREARAVAALNHPKICTLHYVGPDSPGDGAAEHLKVLRAELADGHPAQLVNLFPRSIDARNTARAEPVKKAISRCGHRAIWEEMKAQFSCSRCSGTFRRGT